MALLLAFLKACMFGTSGESNELLPFHPFWLKFRDVSLEEPFREFSREHLNFVRKRSLLVSSIVVGLWVWPDIVDIGGSQEILRLIVPIRVCVALWGIMVWFSLFSKNRFFQKTVVDEFIWAFTCFIIPFCFMIIRRSKNQLDVGHGAIMAMVAVNVFVGASFRTYCAVTFALPLAFLVVFGAMGSPKVPFNMLFDDFISIFSISIFLTANSYYVERHFREEFRISRMMREQCRLRTEEALELSRVSRLADEAKSRFLAVMSHEMRGPLHAIYAMTQLLSQSELDSQDEESVLIIARSSELLMSLISDVLDVSRFDSNAMKLQMEPIDIFETVEDVAYICESEVYKRENLEIFTKFSPGVPTVV